MLTPKTISLSGRRLSVNRVAPVIDTATMTPTAQRAFAKSPAVVKGVSGSAANNTSSAPAINVFDQLANGL